MGLVVEWLEGGVFWIKGQKFAYEMELEKGSGELDGGDKSLCEVGEGNGWSGTEWDEIMTFGNLVLGDTVVRDYIN